MSFEILTLFEINAFVLIVSTISMAILSIIYLRPHQSVFSLMLLVPAVAALAYVFMSLEIGFVQTGDGVVNSVRYIDWLITTPILLYILAYVSVPDSGERLRTFLYLFVTDMVMLVAGIGAELFTGGLKITLFVLSTLAYIGMLYVVINLMINLNKSALAQKQRTIALTMAWVILILWSVYPFIWVFGTQGVAAVGVQGETIAYMILDVLTKVGFASLLLWYLHLQTKVSLKSKT